MRQRISPSEYISRAAVALDELHSRIAAAEPSSPLFVLPEDCGAMRDVRASSDEGAVKTAVSQSFFFAEHAGDHLAALARLLSGDRIILIASWTAVRSLLESSAWLLWLLDPDVDVAERLGRSLAIRKRGQTEIGRLGTLFEKADLSEFGLDRIRTIDSAAVARGLRSANTPPVSEVIAEQLGARREYALLSAVAHANPALMLSLLYETDRDLGVARKFARPELLVGWVRRATEWFARAVWLWAKYRGLDLRPYLRRSGRPSGS